MIKVGQNSNDDVTHTCLENEVKDRSHEACCNYDNGYRDTQEGENADEDEARLQREVGL
jgi:hypothetical protein